MSLSEHVYCVAVAFKMTERAEQWICIKFCIKLETIHMIQKAAVWAIDDWQLHQDNAPTHASCLMQRLLAKHQITQVTHPLQPRFGALRL